MSKERVLTKYAKKARGLVSSEEIAKFFEVDDKPEIFNDIVVIDVSYANFAGIYASSILAEFGAEVIKVEPPEGDPARFMTPNGVNLKGVGIPFLIEARNKRFITLDLENNEKDREKFKKLAAKADVIIETYEPGKMDSIGIGYKQLSQINSKLIYVAISTWGQLLPYEGAARIPDSDITAQALSGIASLIGDIKTEPEPFNWPTRAGSWISWYIAGVHAAAGIMLALLYRRKSGKGQMIDVSTADSYANHVGYPIIVGALWKKPRPRTGVLDVAAFPYSIWKCKDGFVAITSARDNAFRALLKILGLWRIEPDWRFPYDRVPDIIENALELYNEIAKALSKWNVDDFVEKCMVYSSKAVTSRWRGGGTPMAVKMETPGTAMKHPHWHIRRTFMEINDPNIGRFIVVAPPARMTESPPRIKWISYDIGKDQKYVEQKFLS